ncbi:hypothetical protein UFOVP1549_14 [uncultured Caudovirales phage]|uniref:Uncharacterized protein n=1 Tax=uncultured Caudovirales phage TaxID=2100421 RepID=A0A6J5LNC6_9CAUD|nr:hypothetical protein UFOVP303_19 [uncultured Caudovirales phage]CAB5228498.1 hypothetical protein UFOVP1549_14 [uncultured Caudovirales phage]
MPMSEPYPKPDPRSPRRKADDWSFPKKPKKRQGPSKAIPKKPKKIQMRDMKPFRKPTKKAQ